MSLRLIARNVVKSYGGRAVLSGCTVSFDRKGVYLLTGGNGSGKSTFLRICALLEKPDAGELVFADEDRPLVHDTTLRRRITLVLPRIGVFNDTVFNNAAYGLKVRGIPRAAAAEAVMNALATVGLDGKARQHARTLSTGETQRLGIARALVIRPEILFLDEPTASIDEENTELVEEIILTLKDSNGTTIVMTTHDREQAQRLSDRQLVIRQGTIEAAGDATAAKGNQR